MAVVANIYVYLYLCNYNLNACHYSGAPKMAKKNPRMNVWIK